MKTKDKYVPEIVTDCEDKENILQEIEQYSISPRTLRRVDTHVESGISKFMEKTKSSKDTIHRTLTKLNDEAEKLKKFSAIQELVGQKLEEYKTLQNQTADLITQAIKEKQQALERFNFSLEKSLDYTQYDMAHLYRNETYESDDHKALTRYSINVKTEGLSQVLLSYNRSFQSEQDKLSKLLKDCLSQHSSTSSRGSKSKKIDKPEVMKDKIYSIPMHTFEALLLEKAVSRLEGTNSIVIDILARDSKTGLIKFEESRMPEVHSIVIHKNIQGRLIAIDPSNSNFSRDVIQDYNLFLRESSDRYILSFQKEVKIYQALGKTGAKIDQYRDCIDVAVKIGLALKSDQITKEQSTDAGAFLKSTVISSLSNIPANNEYLPNLEFPLRIHQATESVVRQQFRLISKYIDQQIKSIGSLILEQEPSSSIKIPGLENLEASVKSKFLDTLRNVSDDIDYNSALQKLGALAQEVTYAVTNTICNNLGTKLTGLNISATITSEPLDEDTALLGSDSSESFT